MRSKSAELQYQINEIDRKIQEGVNLSARNQLEAQRNDLNDQLQVALAEEAQQNLQERVEQAKETGYLLDTLESNGIPLIELSHTPENHELVAIAVQKFFLAQQDTYNSKIAEVTELADKWATISSEKDIEIENLNAEVYQIRIEKSDAESKRDNSINRMEEMANELNVQAEEIKKLKEQLAGNVIPLAPLSAEERETKLLAELNGNRVKVTNVRLKDTNGFDTRISLANNALTGEEIEFHTIYIKRYEEISAGAAEQLREEYAAKKAEIEAQNAVIPVQEADVIEYVTEQDETATDKLPIEEEVRAAAFGLAEESSSGDREVVAEESQIDLDIEVVFTLEYVRQLRILEEKVALIESKLVA